MMKKLLPGLAMVLLSLALFSCTKRKPEEIDYAPNSPFNPYPPDSSTNIDHTTLDVTLRWTSTDPNSGDVLTYAIYLDTLKPPLIQIATGLSSPSFFLTGLSYNTTYYWNLYITDDQGVTTSGPVWRFTTLPHANTAPNVPVYLYPSNGAAWQYPTLDFGWDCTDPEEGSDTLYYDLYLGITSQLPINPYKNDTASIREFTGLEYTTTYFWKIVVHDNHYAYTTGPVQSFATRDCPWFYKRELPSARYGFGTAVVNNKTYVIGGTDDINYLNEVLEYDPLLDTWVRKADMPTPRSDMAVAVWNGKIYAIGGRSSVAIFSNNEVYDPLLNSWSTLAPSYQGNHTLTAQAVNGKIFTLGGDWRLGFINGGVFEYDIATDDWWDTLLIHADTVAPDTIYVDTVYNNVKSFLPEYRYGICSALYNNDIYVLGGAPLISDPTPNVDIYHPASNTWTTAAPMPGPATFPAAVVANGFIYVLGGYDINYLRRVRKYDPVMDAWFVRGDMRDHRSAFGTAFIGDRIYAIGGTALFPLATVEEYQINLDPKNIRR